MEMQNWYEQLGWQKGAILPATGCGGTADTSGWDTAAIKALILVRPKWVTCPSDTAQATAGGYGVGSYALNHGTIGPSKTSDQNMKHFNTGVFMYVTQISFKDILDGMSNTFAAGEVFDGHTANNANYWTIGSRHTHSLRTTENAVNTKPGTGIHFNNNNGAFGSRHPAGALFAYCDGHVSFIPNNINLNVYKALSTRAGAETVEVP